MRQGALDVDPTRRGRRRYYGVFESLRGEIVPEYGIAHSSPPTAGYGKICRVKERLRGDLENCRKGSA